MEAEQKSTDSMLSLADDLEELTERKRALESEVKDINKKIETVQELLVQEMVDHEMQNFTRQGKMFYLQTATYVSGISGEQENLMRTLKDQGFDDIVKETVHPQTLKGFVKEQMDEEGGELPDWLQGLVNVFKKEQVRMRKSS